MVARAALSAAVSYADYLQLEQTSPTRHEYLSGQVLAMAGGTPEHAALCAAVSGILRDALEGRRCRVYSSDLRIRVEQTDLSSYPDESVVCTALETSPVDPHAATNPVVLVEVLSDLTEAYDRGAKAAHYRFIPSLRDYVLVSQGERRIEVQHKNADGVWELREYRPGEDVILTSLDVRFAVDQVYRDPLSQP
ncbi:MAG: Uma2 family endonuclease [Deltaproteobacteria bacterium]|nr:Uma2 family endonuclease [Deltaproteobacteria bacterium]